MRIIENAKKCPICGNKPEVGSDTIKGYEPSVSVSIYCSVCGYPKRGSSDTVGGMSFNDAFNDAVMKWNDEVDYIEHYLRQRDMPSVRIKR